MKVKQSLLSSLFSCSPSFPMEPMCMRAQGSQVPAKLISCPGITHTLMYCMDQRKWACPWGLLSSSHLHWFPYCFLKHFSSFHNEAIWNRILGKIGDNSPLRHGFSSVCVLTDAYLLYVCTCVRLTLAIPYLILVQWLLFLF